ncbi:hypothetical protein GCM10017786_03540 [Amycolatopsis deserti]|uniref:Methyltransferase domain-containing protein n=1 Tax=Amycolatopsis deserti TaxID=185696 RepID=A0ABQ3IF21_9PSEU|nr:hypothetical protein [Amycolatopsis deserti]GHE77415.1 hypothetical protein GCM10017786_03540 [Amycolatopsis deserti]
MNRNGVAFREMNVDPWDGAGPGEPGRLETTRCAPEWLALREPADAAARATELLGPLREHLRGRGAARRPDGAPLSAPTQATEPPAAPQEHPSGHGPTQSPDSAPSAPSQATEPLAAPREHSSGRGAAGHHRSAQLGGPNPGTEPPAQPREHLNSRLAGGAPDRPAAGSPPGDTAPLVIRDLGSGTGSMARWLAPRLGLPQHWVLHDRDPGLLARAAVPGASFETHIGDLTGLDLTGTALLTASALLDLLTASEVDTIAEACAAAGCAALLTLSVAGRVELTPADPLDAHITAAFNAHQRRGNLLGPDAIAVATRAFERRGAVVHHAPSPWRLGPGQRELTGQWLRGWVAAARRQEPRLDTAAYLRRRLDACAAGDLRVVVHHTDLLAIGAA